MSNTAKTWYDCNDGYYKTRCYCDNRLEYMPAASAGVVNRSNGDRLLKSYSTFVLKLDQNGWLQCTGTYSNTTRKHIGAFLKQYAPNTSYYIAKQIYKDNLAYNVHTGELRPLNGQFDVYGFQGF